MARAAQSQASNLQGTDASNAATAGSNASSIYSGLNPFLTREMNNPQGYSQQDLTSMLSSAEAGAGGANSGITGQANLQAARTRNAGGFGAALDSAARSRQQSLAGTAEGIAGQNAQLKQSQQQAGAAGLQGLYGQNQDSMLKSLGLQDQAIGTEVDAGKSGWLQNALGIAGAAEGALTPFGKGGAFSPGGRWG